MSKTVTIDPDRLPLGAGVRLIKQHPAGVFALEKPAGILSHPNKPGDRGRSLLKAAYTATDRRYHGFDATCPVQELYLIHRLDSAATGVILLCSNADLAAQMREQFTLQKVEKTYIAIVKGRPPNLPAVWIDRLEKRSSRSGPVRARPGGPTASIARTAQHCLRGHAGRAGLSMMQLSPQTGRTHQLRCQCAIRGHPILGDRVYGDFQLNRSFAAIAEEKRLFLHAASIKLSFQAGGANHHFEAESPLPESFDAALHAVPALLKQMSRPAKPLSAHKRPLPARFPPPRHL